jgi:hypothetical protein
MLRTRVGVVVALGALAVAVSAGAAGAQVDTRVHSAPYERGATAHASAKKIRAKVKIAGLTGSVTGGVKSKKRICEKGRLASLIQVTFAGLVEIDREKTTKKGKFALEGAVPGQTYFVGVGKKTITKFGPGGTKKTICPQTKSGNFVP